MAKLISSSDAKLRLVSKFTMSNEFKLSEKASKARIALLVLSGIAGISSSGLGGSILGTFGLITSAAFLASIAAVASKRARATLNPSGTFLRESLRAFMLLANSSAESVTLFISMMKSRNC